MRNRFAVGDTLQVLSPNESFNKEIIVTRLEDLDGVAVTDAKIVQQKLKLFTDVSLDKGDIMRVKS